MQRVKYKGEIYEFDEQDMTNREVRQIERFTGKRMDASTAGESFAADLTVLLWLALTRNGDDVTLDNLEFRMNDVEVLEAEPDPTDSPVEDALPLDPPDPTVESDAGSETG